MLEFEFSRVLRVQTSSPAFAGDFVERALGRQRVELGGGAAVAKHATGPVAVRVVNEVVALALGLRDAPFGGRVRRHVVSIPGQVVARFGLRHRAAAGISERTDALAVTVSEETGNIHIFYDGDFEKVQKEDLTVRLAKLLQNK